VQKIKFVGVVVFEKFKAIVDGYAYAYDRPWDKDRRRNSSVLIMYEIQYVINSIIAMSITAAV
jgi:hypothetical protein